MSLSCWTWRSLRRSSTNSWRSDALSGSDELATPSDASAPLEARIQFNMLVSWQPNSRASSLGLRPVATKSIICWRNSAGYGGFGLCVLGISDSFLLENKVSVKKGQLQIVADLSLDKAILQHVVAKNALKPSQRRSLVPELMTLFGCSQRNALRVVKMSASTYLYKPVKNDDQAMTMRIKDITATRVHYGYRRVHVRLRREGYLDDVKRVYRL